METFFGSEYWLSRFLFQKALAVIYLVAFLVILNQFRPLLGEYGLLPVPRFLSRVNFIQAPSIFHFFYSDTFLMVVAWIGILLSVVALLGLPERLSWWASAATWGLLWVLYLSIVNVGQTFYAFGWESLLLEVGFLAIFLGSNKLLVPVLIIFLLRWVLFRLEFGAGLIKLRGDECWRDLTCLMYHHETQPMPNMFSWYFHNLPAVLHKFEVVGNFFFQLIVPWGLFFRQPIAGISAGLIIVSQLWLVISGNFSWLNWMAIVLALSGFSNVNLGKLIPFSIPTMFSRSFSHEISVMVVAVCVIFLSYWPVKNMLSRKQMMNASFDNLHLVNTYGAFGTVTKKRYEIVVEGAVDPEIRPDTVWREYEFKGKPGDITRRPRQYAPYHLRLDWLMWFLPFNLHFNSDGRTSGPYYHEQWYVKFVEKLLHNDQAIVGLIRHNPFQDAPPHFIRARVYLYEFTTPDKRRQTGNWWKREFVGEYLPAVSLSSGSE